MTTPAQQLLHEDILDALQVPSTARQVTRRVNGPYWLPEEDELVQRALGELVRLGAVTVSGVTYSRAPQRCLCGAALVGEWTAGTHHQAHRCARVIT